MGSQVSSKGLDSAKRQFKNSRMKKRNVALALVIWVFFAGCLDRGSQQTRDDPQITASRTPSLLYQPGEIPWLEKTRGAVFHSLEEGLTTSREQITPHIERRYPLKLNGLEYHLIVLRRFSRAYPSGQTKREAARVGGIFTGVYLPEELEQDPANIHLFECPYKETWSGEAVYFAFGDMVIECNESKEFFIIHIPALEKYQDWFECEVLRHLQTDELAKSTCLRTFEYQTIYWVNGDSNDVSDDTHLTKRIFKRMNVGPIRSDPTRLYRIDVWTP